MRCNVISKVLNLKDPIKMFLAIIVDKEAIKRAEELGIKLIYGEVRTEKCVILISRVLNPSI
ncbi:hypothetical protein SJAV_26740 [Sulfurisphaera javensis]|uniref:Uncharacterized protein n=1 Tax=Sulfurisphaera javensis TaxID=2049879 RepID=A0AAT9GUW6_9CREN